MFDNVEVILQKKGGGGEWNGFIWLRIRISVGL
jgi:hypothetical protein